MIKKAQYDFRRNEKGLSTLANRHPELASIANKIKGQIKNALSGIDVFHDYGIRYSRNTEAQIDNNQSS